MPGYAHLRSPRSGRFCAYLCRRQFRSSVVPRFGGSAVRWFRGSVVPLSCLPAAPKPQTGMPR